MDQRNKKGNKKVFDVLAGLAIMLIIWIIIRSVYINPKKLEEGDVSYTVAIITSFTNPTDGGKDANFIYTVNGKKYKGFFNASKIDTRIGDRYFLKFLKSDPDISQFLFDMSVPDSIINIPKEGWEQLP
ncbi:hypothetical protein I5907_12490 [Panacibacter sp. DH6]|uniref:Uncharacterized protein n=1 Tax=Panacibacter microcysteis TaxID=2793269 RepID=A0A931GY06_9BACT|nr:hypothetical protein [Panacibacter microcysteis]MBG9377054.1 hypothetical protein [Panacibacter microcysteis]